MYVFYLTMKTPNGIFALCILVYTILLAVLCPVLRKKEKYSVIRILCVLPVIAALIHLGIFGTLTLRKYRYLYISSLLPLIYLLPGKSGRLTAVKSAVSSLTVFALCLCFLVKATSAPLVHNFTKLSYTESFEKMLGTMEKEYCLSSWKQMDYDSLRDRYMPKVEEAEKNNDALAFASVMYEVAYRFYDTHVSVSGAPDEIRDAAADAFSGSDYGVSLVRLDDGSVIAVYVEPGSDVEKQGIHNGTVILSWDGDGIDEAIEDTECIYTKWQYPVKSNEDVYRPFFLAAKGGESVEVTFVGENGEIQSAALKKQGSGKERLLTAYYAVMDQVKESRHNYACMLDDKCGYLRVTREHYGSVSDYVAVVRKGYYPELTEYYAGLIEELKAQGMEYLIIDIRNNGGGYDCCAGALASLFTDEKRHMVSFGYEDSEGYHIKESQYIFPDGRYRELPVVALVNDRCVSAGDGMAKFLGDCDNVTLMGLTASGGVNQNNGGYMYLPDGLCMVYPVFLSLSSDGEPLIDTDHTRENRVPLEVTIPMTKERALELFSFTEENDVELEYAVEYIETH